MGNNQKEYRILARGAVYTKTGKPEEVLRIKDYVIPPTKHIGPDEIIVQMLAAPINHSDLSQIEGTYGVPAKIEPYEVAVVENRNGKEVDVKDDEALAVGGNEGVGRVIAVGSYVKKHSDEAVKQGKKSFIPSSVGQWVFPRPGRQIGTWTTHQLTDTSDYFAFPEPIDLKPEQAASIQAGPSTAFRLLQDFAKMNPGEYIMQDAANSGVGQAVIQLAHNRGLHTVNIMRDRKDWDARCAHLKTMGADIIIKQEDLLENPLLIKQHPDLEKISINLGFDAVGGRTSFIMSDSLADNSTLVNYGNVSKEAVKVNPSSVIFNNITIKSFWLSKWYRDHPASEWYDMWSAIIKLIHEGRFITQEMEPLKWSVDAPIDTLNQQLHDAVTSKEKHMFIFEDNDKSN